MKEGMRERERERERESLRYTYNSHPYELYHDMSAHTYITTYQCLSDAPSTTRKAHKTLTYKSAHIFPMPLSGV